jgi:hypothetical protein
MSDATASGSTPRRAVVVREIVSMPALGLRVLARRRIALVGRI